MEEIGQEMFGQFKPKFVTERDEVAEKAAKADSGVSNLEKTLDRV